MIPPVHENRKIRQLQVATWCAKAFGSEQAYSVPHRGLRFFEEASEGAQASGVTKEMAHKMVDYVWSRPVGELAQELGGIGVTVLALAEAARLSADLCERNEIVRVLSKPLEHFADRNQVKNDAGFNLSGESK